MLSFMIGMLVMLVSSQFEISRIRSDYNFLLRYLGEGDSRNIVRDMASMLRAIERDNRFRDNDIERLYLLIRTCVQKAALVRYNAFQNVGNELSFSLALLDSEDNGFVLSSIYGRDTSTTYAKPVRAGVSGIVLTEEEEDAISIARQLYADKVNKKA